MINPRQLNIGYVKNGAYPFRMKQYYPLVGRVTFKHAYRTATEAKARAVKVYTRWCRLYDAALVGMMKVDEPETERAMVAADSAPGGSPSTVEIIPVEVNHER